MKKRRLAAHAGAVSLAALAGIAAGSLSTTPVAGADGPTYHVANSQIGVRLRSAPQAEAIYQPLTVVPDGTPFSLKCQEWGDPVGPNANRVWDRVVVDGISAELPDTWTDTPAPANQFTTSECGSALQGSSPCLQGSTCSAPVAPSSAPSTPSPAAQQAVAWAQQHLGATGWAYQCLAFVYQAWTVGAGQDIGGPTGPEVAARDWWDAHGSAQHTDSNAPAGAMVFWSWTGTVDGVTRDWGHTALALGDGNVITTDFGGVPSVHETSIADISQSLSYLGWLMPQ